MEILALRERAMAIAPLIENMRSIPPDDAGTAKVPMSQTSQT